MPLFKGTVKLSPGKYKVTRHIPERKDSYREKPGGEVISPQIITAHWTETIIQSDEIITITRLGKK